VKSMMATGPTKTVKLFFCYARKDKAYRDELDQHLSLLKRQKHITTWDDHGISPGSAWEKEIDTHLDSAHLILLLVSRGFLASDYCYGIEMKRALERHEAGTAHVIPIILRPVYWKGAPFSHLQVLPTDARPVTNWTDRDDAFADITENIYKTVEELQLSLKTKEEWLKDGVALGRLKRYEEALAVFEQAIRLDPNYPLAYASKGYALEHLGRNKDAQQAFERARQLGYDSLPFYPISIANL
jgi:tetratricopeptide (TPR) repeat protein